MVPIHYRSYLSARDIHTPEESKPTIIIIITQLFFTSSSFSL